MDCNVPSPAEAGQEMVMQDDIFEKQITPRLKGSGCEGNHETKPAKHAATASGKYVQG
jgi:hypothetical protein